MHRRNALHCLSGIQRLGEKTQMWVQRMIDSCRDQYSDLEVQKEIDALQDRLDRQKGLLKKRLARDPNHNSDRESTNPPEIPAGQSPVAIWQQILDQQEKEKQSGT
jgi:hypothetical protein